MKPIFITPHVNLRPYITKLWLYESDAGMPESHDSIVAPNGRPKIIIPYKNSLYTTGGGKTEICKENDIFFIGIRDMPVTLSATPKKTGSIGIELTTSGAYKFLANPMHELTNTLASFTDIYGKNGIDLQGKIAGAPSVKTKIEIIQNFLLERLIAKGRMNMSVDSAVNLIWNSHGLMKISEIENKTGYSRRYLAMLFKDFLGISPKTLACIVRFQKFYKHWLNQEPSQPKGDLIYELYYDQAHFIKEFKRHTGYTPTQFSDFQNSFGRLF